MSVARSLEKILDTPVVTPETPLMNYIGLISGTSMDAVDAVVVSIPPTGRLQLKTTHSEPYPEEVRAQLQTLANASTNELDRVGQLDALLGELFAQAANRVRDKAGLDSQEIRAIGSHGQTVRHRPNAQHPFSLQIGNPSIIAERTGITAVADFRARDIAAGGQGAPLAPSFHKWMFHSPDRSRAIINIGGIANASYLPAHSDEPVIGFDTGPGNTLLDSWIYKHRKQAYDSNGQWGASGKCLVTLVKRLGEDPYFTAPPPKSTGFEYFNIAWLERHLGALKLSPAAEDVQATLVELTARSIAQAVTMHLRKVEDVYICGGGSHNRHLMGRLRANLPDMPMDTTAALGIHPDWVEASAFAWLAHQALEGQPSNLPSVTGARRPVVLGGIYKA